MRAKILEIIVVILIQVEYIILTEDAFPCLKRELVDKDTEELTKEEKKMTCDLRHLYKNFLKDKDNDTEEGKEDALHREDLVLFEDNVMEELDDLKDQLGKLHALLKSIQQKLN